MAEKQTDEKVVIIGGSAGIGLTTAKKLVSEGYNVTIAARNPERLDEIKNEFGGKVEIYKLDANNLEEVKAFAERLPVIDHLIITLRGLSVNEIFAESQTDAVKQAFEEKFWPQYYVTRHLLVKIRPGGSVTLTSGIASQRSYSGFFWHAAANGAIESLVKSLAGEIAPVRINAISPGFVERKPNDAEKYEAISKIEPGIPLKRLASQDEIAEGYLFLIRNGYLTGKILEIDGGTLNT
jgi:NAD(P)-dependent dehydrogenase (short-subunit alcohol dehydrogenase family)